MFTPDMSPDGYFGLDLAVMTATQIISPVLPGPNPKEDYDLGDLMSYADDSWISDVTWHKIGLKLCQKRYGPVPLAFDCLPWEEALEDLRTPQETLAAASSLTVTFPYTGDLLLVSGWITEAVSFSAIDRLPEGLMPAGKVDDLWALQLDLLDGGPGHELALYDTSGTLLYTQTFTAGVAFDGEHHDAFFGLVAPWIEGTDRIEVAVNGGLTLSRTVSSNAPTVQLLSPAGGESYTDTVPISWSAEDLDGDPLTFLVQYSADNGATWQVVDSEVSTTSVTLETSLLPGSVGESLVRVIANDGVLVGSAQSDPFSMADHAPMVVLKKPVDQVTVEFGQVVDLEGIAFDPEDGQMTGDAIRWTVEGLGEVGAGREVSVPGLGIGSYEVTMTATDSDGGSDAETITIHMAPRGFAAHHEVFLPLIIR
jgi:hypothetical protein